jgi:heme A synthase
VLTTRTTFRLYARLLAGAMTLQAGLGIATLLHGVPLALAALHQANAVLVVGLWTCVSFHRRILPPVVIKAAGC